MELLSEYNIIETIDNKQFIISRAILEKDHSSVIVKSTGIDRADLVKHIEHEFALAPHLENDWAVKPISLKRTKNEVVLISEDFQGQSLQQYMAGQALQLNKFLKIAVNICSALSKMHAKGIIHKDIKPKNILINPSTDEIRIIDFGSSILLPSESLQMLQNPRTIEGSLPYISPEQTGRVNHVIDYRTDMYSLGVTFYQMITGSLPFSSDDPLDLVYSHIAQKPAAPQIILPEIPKTVSDIIMKLLSKLAEDRYQSMNGLKADLENCLEQLHKNKVIVPFVPGEKDASSKLSISQKLYGRENEISILINAYEEVVNTGKPSLVLVSGYAGIGKTALVSELYKPITHEKGFFISGKFNRLKRDIPYSTIVDAFQSLIISFLSESEEQLANWKERLNNALGKNGQLVVDIIPQLELIIGKQDPVTALPPLESQNRFKMTFEKFIGVLSGKEHPLVIFIDDLQWSDSGSLNLIRQMLLENSGSYILVIGAYRDNEVTSTHPLMLVLEEIKKSAVAVKEIKVSALGQDHIQQLINDSIKAEREAVHSLAELVNEKTKGNPFFVKQFLIMLYEEQLIKFDHAALKWRWELNSIRTKGYTDNVIDLISARIKRQPVAAQKLLSLAAGIGSIFDKKTLSIISSVSENEIETELHDAFMQGIIISFDHRIKFSHDRFQESAYELIPAEKRGEVHLKIARLLLENTPENLITEKIFDIVNQFNRSNLSGLNGDEKIKIANYNYKALIRAKTSIAYDSAVKFASFGLALLSEKDWDENYELIFTLNLEKGECEYLNGNFSEAEKIIDYLLKRVSKKIDKASVHRLKMRVHLLKGEVPLTVSVALVCLKDFNIIIPAHPTGEEVFAAYKKVNESIGNRKVEDLVELPLMTDPEMKAAMGILSELYAAASFTDQNLYALHLAEMIDISVKYGNNDTSVLAYGAYGIAIAASFNEYRKGYEFAEIGVKLVEKHKFSAFNAKAIFLLGVLTAWFKHISKSVDLFRQSFQAAVESGDIPIAGYSCINLIIHLEVKGEKLADLAKEIENLLVFVRKTKFTDMETILICQHRYVLAMQGHTENLSSFNGEDFNEEVFEKHLPERLSSVQFGYYIYKMKAGFFDGNIEDAMAAGLKAKELLVITLGFITSLDFYYYYSLTLAAHYSSATSEEKKNVLEILKQNEAIIKARAEDCPENFLDKYLLVAAEICRITGKKEDAASLYENAIKSAGENGFIHNQAICYELASAFYKDLPNETLTHSFIKNAYDCYSKWGFSSKLKQLEKLYPFLKKHKIGSEGFSLEGLPVEQLDLIAIIKASQAISENILSEKLNEALIRVIMQQSGAGKGYLLFEYDGKLSVVSEAVSNGEIVVKVHDIPLEPDYKLFPEKIFQFVKRTGENIIIDDAKQDKVFGSDKYIEASMPRSIACLPIIKQKKHLGIIYLENNLIPGAFSADKIAVLKILTSQAAISIENTFYYRELKKLNEALEQQVKERTVTLTKTQAVLQLNEEKYRKMVEEAGDAVYSTDYKGHLTYVNPVCKKFTGYTANELVGKHFLEIIAPDWKEKVAKFYKEQFENKVQVTLFSFPIITKSGEKKWIEQTIMQLREGNLITGYNAIVRDITERKKSEETIKQKSEELARSNTELEQFAYISSHDLQEPLRTITNFVGLFEKEYSGKLDSDATGYLNVIVTAASRMRNLIKDLLEFSRVGREMKFESIDCNSVLKEVKEEMATSIKESNAKITISNLPVLNGNYLELKRLFQNLISNALKFQKKDVNPEITITVEEKDNEFVFAIKDNGIGIDEQYNDQLFIIFKRLHSTSEYPGTGIGLATCKKIVDLHNGKIWVESKLGNGSTFYFSIPKKIENKI